MSLTLTTGTALTHSDQQQIIDNIDIINNAKISPPHNFELLRIILNYLQLLRITSYYFELFDEIIGNNIDIIDNLLLVSQYL